MRDSAPDLEWGGARYCIGIRKERGEGVEERKGEEKEVKSSEVWKRESRDFTTAHFSFS